MTDTVHAVDLADPDLYAVDDGMAVFERLRVVAPVYWNHRATGFSFWSLLRHADAMTVYANPNSFTSERGMQVGQEEAAARAAAARMLIVTDGMRHSQLRSVLNPLLTPAAIRRFAEPMRAVVREALHTVAERDSFDFVAEIAARLPMSVICQLLGVPRPDWELMVNWTRTAFGSVATDNVITPAQRTEANANIFAYYADLVRQRRTLPGDDLISSMCQANIDGVPLTDEEILLNINGLITGGNETTRHASAGAVRAFIDHPDQWHLLRAQPKLLHTTIEEVLRWTAPSLNVMRTVLSEIVVGGQLMRPGERVSIWNPAVNRDPAVFPEPQRFDIARAPNRHLTFGNGRHLCIGAALARFELQVLLGELTTSVREIHPAGPMKRLRSNLMWGIDRLPIRIELEQTS